MNNQDWIKRHNGANPLADNPSAVVEYERRYGYRGRDYASSLDWSSAESLMGPIVRYRLVE